MCSKCQLQQQREVGGDFSITLESCSGHCAGPRAHRAQGMTGAGSGEAPMLEPWLSLTMSLRCPPQLSRP